eukprot:c18943_g1_i2.p1 GENE.c18943_g1_i2~~c18943_g1_i2.p1  ORF type:complete len:123 (+),score=17.14 c18943_g1_i2:694-1062(+)
MTVWISCCRHSLSAQSLPPLWSRSESLPDTVGGYNGVLGLSPSLASAEDDDSDGHRAGLALMSQLIVGDRCFGVTRKFWKPCSTNTTKFDIAVDLQESNSFVSLLTQDTMWPAVRLGTVHEI